ncbi:MAG: AraC family transcriptional regulator [Rhizobacter sp.]|nr:AraC family transcriptional regulator [Ferruginibacter sp.]
MQVQFYTPHPLLQEFINCIMIIHAEVEADGRANICIYPPTPQTSLFFYINDRVKVKKENDEDFILQPRSALVGLQATTVTLDINSDHKAVRVGFHPGGMYRLLGISMKDMIDDHYDAEDVFGKEMKIINEQLAESKSFDAIRNVIESFLLDKVKSLKSALPFDMAMLEMLRYNGNMPMEKIASLACLSLRQFERVSKDRIGISPKLYARLARFSKAYRLRENFPAISWTSIAYECGYFDQMHLIRDFKEFAGMLPGIIEKELEGTPIRLQASMRL